MRLAVDRSPGAYAVRVRCLTCGRERSLADVAADLDGPAFRAYYCLDGVLCGPEDPTREPGALMRAKMNAEKYARQRAFLMNGINKFGHCGQ